MMNNKMFYEEIPPYCTVAVVSLCHLTYLPLRFGERQTQLARAFVERCLCRKRDHISETHYTLQCLLHCLKTSNATAAGTEFGVVKGSIGIYTAICLQPFIPSPPLHDILAGLYTSTTVSTRWGSWLEACNYYARHLQSVKKVVQSFDTDDAAAIQIRQQLLNDETIEKEVTDIKSNFGYLPHAIIQLGKSGVELVEQINIMRTIVNKLSAVEGEVGKRVGEKMNRVLIKNDGIRLAQSALRLVHTCGARLTVEPGTVIFALSRANTEDNDTYQYLHHTAIKYMKKLNST
ncbi:hypothetical protein ANN_26361 [Periplaneta americana]|uniref:Uncharacterized protein n=1 Tax=Periplaneta americana TaxID=6978 RepID=A0ABQ8RY00_PERAM|nr:hypothetical protein ANN_26361 [Periplaneta americana]